MAELDTRTSGSTNEIDTAVTTAEVASDAPSSIEEAFGSARFLNREMSWLDFNSRVLALAEDASLPVLERVKFLAIFSQNLDEFFQVRFALLKDRVEAGLGGVTPDGTTVADQIRGIRDRVRDLMKRVGAVFLGDVVPALADEGIVLSGWGSLDDDDRDYLVQVFGERLFPVLTPLAVDPAHPFPYISSLSLSLAVEVRNPETGEERFARVKVPGLLPRFIVMPDGERIVPVEQVIAAHLDQLFPGMEILAHHPFRVTRNADITIAEEEADDLLEAIETELSRRRFGRAVRLEIDSSMPDDMRELLVRELEVRPDDLYMIDGPLQLTGLWAVYELDRPDLKEETWVGVTQPRLFNAEQRPADLFAVIRERDVLVHHPYDSFSTSIEAFVEQAATDPNVLAIKQTLYRTSGDSPIIKSLMLAAERGKQVVALVELKARFDEQANIAWARALEDAGVHVVYGLVGLKTHTKTCLVVRDEPEGLRRYCHVGTGNYNSKTARIYEDLGLLTADPDICTDLTELFNHLTGYSQPTRHRKLLVAPSELRPAVAAMIAAEAAAPAGDGRILMKMNSLVDPELIDSLYRANQAGVEIDLIVRGICCLRPGVPGLSEHIRVRSIVGRFLEHSRIFAFGPRERRRYLIGSADIMPRNLDRRVEAVAPVDDPELTDRLEEILDVLLEDDSLAWELDGDGEWHKVPTVHGLNTQVRLQEIAMERARRRRVAEPSRG